MKIFQNNLDVSVKAGVMTAILIFVLFLFVFAFKIIVGNERDSWKVLVFCCLPFCVTLGFLCFKLHDRSHILYIGDGKIKYKRHGETMAVRSLSNYIGFEKFCGFHTNRVKFTNEDDLIVVGFSGLMVNEIRHYLDMLKAHNDSAS